MFIHIHIPALEAQVERLCRPRLCARPLIVQSEAADVVSAWPQIAGIGRGSSAWEARLRCPQAAVSPADEQKYLFFWQQVCEIAARYSPVLHEEPIHRICLDMAGTEMLFGSAKQAARRMVQQMAHLGLIARMGLGPSRIMARLAADTAGDGIGEITARELSALPIDALPDLDPRIHKVLRDLGLLTFADVQAVPAHMLKAAFGEAGERLCCAVRGADHSAPERSMPEESRRLTPAVDDAAALRGVLMSLAESLGRRLRKSGLAATQVRLRIGFRPSRERSFSSAAPQETNEALAHNDMMATKMLQNATASDEDLFRAALPALMRTRRPVRLLALGAPQVCPVKAAGQLRFSRPLQDLDQALDKIKDRYGEAVLRRAASAVPTR